MKKYLKYLCIIIAIAVVYYLFKGDKANKIIFSLMKRKEEIKKEMNGVKAEVSEIKKETEELKIKVNNRKEEREKLKKEEGKLFD